jgi:hypothetical protein
MACFISKYSLRFVFCSLFLKSLNHMRIEEHIDFFQIQREIQAFQICLRNFEYCSFKRVISYEYKYFWSKENMNKHVMVTSPGNSLTGR